MIAKLLLTAIVIAVVWFGFQYLQRLAELKDRRDRRRAAPKPDAPAATVQDLVKCPVCGVWQAGDARRPCGRADCPY